MTRIYEQLNTKTLGDVEGTDIQALQDKVHIQEANKEELETYNLINEAAMRNGSPMPRGIRIMTTTVTDNVTTVGFTVPAGEVYQLVTIGGSAVNPSGNSDYRFFQSGTDTDGADVNIMWFIYTTGNNTAPVFQADADFPDMPMFYDEDTTLKFSVSGSFTSVTLSISMIRVR
jgi:hypothetical protein